MCIADSTERTFAIPINTVRHITQELIEHGEVVHGWLGVEIQEVDWAMAEEFKLEKPMGALINSIIEDSPAAEAGLQRGDVITAVVGKTVNNPTHLRHIVAMHKPNSIVSVTVMRDGKRRDIFVIFGEHGKGGRVGAMPSTNTGATDWKGLSLQDLTPDLAESFGYAPNEGVLIAGVEPRSPAAKVGEADQKLQRGDLLLEVDHNPAHSVNEFKSVVKTAEDSVLLQVKRDERVWFVVVK